MSGETFFDTSILVYAYDKGEPKKQEICSKLVREVFDNKGVGYLSNQILAELYFTLVKKKQISKGDAETIILSFMESGGWIKLNYDIETVKNAISFSRNINVLFWDILIAETMKKNGIVKIYTENEKDFQKIPGIRVINPLKKK